MIQSHLLVAAFLTAFLVSPCVAVGEQEDNSTSDHFSGTGCHCHSSFNITIPECVCHNQLQEDILAENVQLKEEVRLMKENNYSLQNTYELMSHITVDGVRWTKFWWYTPFGWPKGETDVLAATFGTCQSNATFCFSRLPASLEEHNAEILAIDTAETVYRWRFDTRNPTAHAVWNAFYHHQQNKVTNSDPWNPFVIKGPVPNRLQDSFMYRSQNGVMSMLLDDDNCDGYSTLSMGHGMCSDNFLSSCGPSGRFGVDLLYDTYCQTPDSKHGLTLYFRDDDNCVPDPCSYDQQCADLPNGYVCA